MAGALDLVLNITNLDKTLDRAGNKLAARMVESTQDAFSTKSQGMKNFEKAIKHAAEMSEKGVEPWVDMFKNTGVGRFLGKIEKIRDKLVDVDMFKTTGVGRFLGKIEKIGDKLVDLVFWIGEWKTHALKAIQSIAKALLSPMKTIKKIGGAIRYIVKGIAKALLGVVKIIKKIGGAIRYIAKGIVKGIAKALLGVVKTIKKIGGAIKKFVLSPFAALKEKFEALPKWAQAALGIFSAAAIWKTFTETLKNLAILHEKLAATAAKVAAGMGVSAKKVRHDFINTALAIKTANPLMDLESLSETMSDFALEGVTNSKKLAPMVASMEQMAFFNSDATKTMTPLISSMVKMGKSVKGLPKALGAVNASFGKFADQGLAIVAKLARFSDGDVFGKLAEGAGKFARGLSAAGLTGEEVSSTLETLLSPDIRQVPDFFKAAALQFQETGGSTEGLVERMKELQRLAKGAKMGFIHEMAENYGVSPELLMTLKRNEVAVEDLFNKAGEVEVPDIRTQYEKATDNAWTILKEFKEKVASVFLNVSSSVLQAIDPFIPKINELIEAVGEWLKSLIGVKDKSKDALGKAGEVIDGLGPKLDKITSIFKNMAEGKGSIKAIFAEIFGGGGGENKEEGFFDKLMKLLSNFLDFLTSGNLSAEIIKLGGAIGGFLASVAAGLFTLNLALGTLGANPAAMAALGAIAVLGGGIGMAIASIADIKKESVPKVSKPVSIGKDIGRGERVVSVSKALTTPRKKTSEESILLDDIRGILTVMAKIDKSQLESMLGVERNAILSKLRLEADGQRG